MVNKPARRKHAQDDKFTCPAANSWGTIGHILEEYINTRAKASRLGQLDGI